MAPHLGYTRVPTVAGPVEIEWSLDAVADLDRFATFLHERFPISQRVSRANLSRGLTFSGDIRSWDEQSPATRNTENFSCKCSVAHTLFSIGTMAAPF